MRFLVLILGLLLNSATPADSPPNIVLLFTDDQPREQFNFVTEGRDKSGKPKNLSPNLDRLAREGVVLDQFYVPCTLCVPSRYVLMTGTYASRCREPSFVAQLEREGQTRIIQNARITSDVTTVAKLLQQQGYFTAISGKNGVFMAKGGVHFPNKRGDPRDPVVASKLRAFVDQHRDALHNAGFDFAETIYPGNLKNCLPFSIQCHNLDWNTVGALQAIDRAADQSQPLFLYLPTTIDHAPGGVRKYEANRLATADGYVDALPEVMPPRDSIPQRLRGAGLDPGSEAANVLWLDDSVGAILERLRERGQLDNTVFLYFIDNGMNGGKGSLYQNGVNVPALIWGKPVQGGRRLDELISSVDVAATLLDLAGLAADDRPTLDGHSFTALLAGRSDSPIRDSVYLEMGCMRGVVKGDYKFLAFRAPEVLQKRFGDKPIPQLGEPNAAARQVPVRYAAHYHDADQLYNIRDDRQERNNLIDDPAYASVVEDLKAELSRYVKRLPGSFGEFAP